MGSDKLIKCASADWRSELGRPHQLKFDDEKKRDFLAAFAISNRLSESARLVGVTSQTVRNHLFSDAEFAAAYEEAEGTYRDRVRKAIYDQGVEGYDEPILGGLYKDTVVATRKVFAPNLLILEARRVDQAYRDRSAVDVNVKGGVLLIPSGVTAEEWAKTYGAPPTTPDQLEAISEEVSSSNPTSPETENSFPSKDS